MTVEQLAELAGKMLEPGMTAYVRQHGNLGILLSIEADKDWCVVAAYRDADHAAYHIPSDVRQWLSEYERESA